MVTKYDDVIVIDHAIAGFPGSSVVKDPPADAGDARDVSANPGWGRSSGRGNGNPFQYSYPENSMDREARGSAAHGVTKSQILLSG